MENRITPFSWALLFLLSLVWGSSFILIKKSLIAFAPEQVACLRIAISALALSPFIYQQSKKIKGFQIKYIMAAAFFGNFFPAFMYAFAQTKVDSALAGILNSLTPLFTLIIGVLLFRTQAKWAKWLGVLMGLLGAGLLVFESANLNSNNNSYTLLIIFGTISYGLSANVIKKYLQNIPPLTATTLSFAIIGPVAIIYLFSTNFIQIMQSHPQALFSLSMVSILAVLGTAIAGLLFVKLIQLTNAVFGAMVSYIIPIIALLWGFYDGEMISAIQIIGLCLILSGVYISGRKEKNLTK